MPNKYLDSVGLAEYTSLIKAELAPKNSPALTGTPTAPTPTAGDDSTKIATTAFVQDEVANYLPLTGGSVTGNLTVSGTITGNVTGTASGNLPLSGGTMTGTITAGTTDILKSSANDSRVVLMGGTAYSSSASVILNGGDASVNAGTFQLLAQGNSSARTFLIGYPNGTLTWGGSNVITAAGGTMTGTLTLKSPIVVANQNVTSRRNVTDSWNLLLGGTSDSNGAYLRLDGSTSNMTGSFTLKASDGTNSKMLVGSPSGTLTWGGNNVITAAGGTMTGNIRFNKVYPYIGGNLTDGSMSVFAGSNAFDGATLQLFGRSDSTYAGRFYLRASTKSGQSDSSGSECALAGRADGTLTWGGLDITPQTFSYSGTSSDVSVPNNTVKNLISFTLTKGTWLVIVNAGFANHSTGYRTLGIATSTTSQNMDRNTIVRVGAATGSNTNLSLSCMLAVSSSTTYYVNVIQTSGSSLNVSGGSMRFRLSAKA